MCRIPPSLLRVALVFFSVGHAAAQSPEWAQFSSSPSGTSPRNDDIHFVDPLRGWAARATDGIYQTTNGGVSFTRVRAASNAYPGTNLVAHYRSIYFASATRGWAGNLGPGSYDASVTDTNLLFETFDGGTTWTPVAAINNSDMKGFCSIQVLDAQHIYGGGRVRGPAHFARSTNGGATWTVTNLTAAGIMGGIMDVHFKDPQNGFLVGMDTNAYTTSCSGYRGAIARTTDGGLTWSNVVTAPVTCTYFWKMSWPSTNVGYVSLQQNGTYSTVVFYKTTDGGASWVSNGIPLVDIGSGSFFLQGIGFVSETEGWMGGSSSVAAPFNFIHTTDGGATWSVAGYDNTQSINRIRFLNASFGYASGRKLHVFRVPLAIVTSPTQQTTNVGANVTFSVTAQGVAPLAYQWRFYGTNLAGATTNVLLLPNVQATNAGNYDVVVSDYSGSVTSAMATLTISGVPVAPTITSQPQGVVVNPGSNATFSVTAAGSAPLAYQWRFDGGNISGATNATFTRTNVQLVDVGNYSVRVTNNVGSVISSDAALALGFADDFDGFGSPVTVTNVGTTNGYSLFFNAAAGGLDFTAIFGFDYSTVTFPTNIGPAPHSTGGTTKGLYLAVNKDANGQVAAVNLYPAGKFFSGNYSMKFDLWLNWSSLGSSSEHALVGINHSGNVTNRIGLATSDGLFFAINADGFISATASTIRDYALYRGGGSGNIPVFMTTNNTTFGPTPPLGPQFDSADSGIAALFPAKSIAGFGTTPVGSAGLGWVSGEVRQVNNLITFLLNGAAIAQYTNTVDYTNGTVLIGHSDNFASIGNSSNFVIFDNLRVEGLVLSPVRLLSASVTGSQFSFRFVTEPYESYTVQWATNVTTPVWINHTSIVGTGATNTVQFPLPPGGVPQLFFRVSRP